MKRYLAPDQTRAKEWTLPPKGSREGKRKFQRVKKSSEDRLGSWETWNLATSVTVSQACVCQPCAAMTGWGRKKRHLENKAFIYQNRVQRKT